MPPEPTDETFKLAKGETLIDALTDRGVTKDAAKALASAIEPVFPSAMIKPGTTFELTLDRQLDFYGRDVTFPVELSFEPGPKETITVRPTKTAASSPRSRAHKAGAKSQYAEFNHFRTKTKVGSSLYGTAKDNKVPDYIIAELTRVFAYDVDFQRQVKAERHLRGVLRQSAHRLVVEAQGAALRAADPRRKDQDLLPLHHQGRPDRLL